MNTSAHPQVREEAARRLRMPAIAMLVTAALTAFGGLLYGVSLIIWAATDYRFDDGERIGAVAIGVAGGLSLVVALGIALAGWPCWGCGRRATASSRLSWRCCPARPAAWSAFRWASGCS